MSSQADGYGVFTGYTPGYYRRLSPNWLRFVAALRDIPISDGEPFRYFELGFGQGVSLNVHAAANCGEFWGNDYNPEHVAFARQMAEASGADIHLLEESFEDLAERNDLPQFQVIVAHGIWSWISDRTREAILRFLGKNLAPGGLFYVSYNALPGSASGIAVQRFLSSVSRTLGDALTETERFDIARSHLTAIKGGAEGHFANYPRALERLEKVLGGTSSYYLHEYTVDTWQPMLLQEVATEIEGIGLEFCGSANLAETDLVQTVGQQQGAQTVLEETLRDFSADRTFRADIFVRRSPEAREVGRRSSPLDQEVALAVLPNELDLVASDPESDATVRGLRALLEDLEERPTMRARLADLCTHHDQDDRQDPTLAVLRALNAGLISPTSSALLEPMVEQTSRLNAFLSSHLPNEKGHQWRASPVIGAAVKIATDPLEDAAEQSSIAELVEELRERQAENGPNLSPTLALKAAVNHRSRKRFVRALGFNEEKSPDASG